MVHGFPSFWPKRYTVQKLGIVEQECMISYGHMNRDIGSNTVR